MLLRTAEFERRQALRRKIARQRRRLDRQLGRVADSACLIGSPQTFVSQNPMRSLLVAAGLGVLLSRLLARDGSLNDLSKRFMGEASLSQIWHDFLAIFRRDSSGGEAEEADGE